jgi:membrane protease subunit HflK
MRYSDDFHRVDVGEVLYKVRRWLPIFVAGLILLLLALGGLTMIYTVQPEEQAVVKRFGAVIKTTAPGLHFKLPFGIDRVQRVATARVLKEEFGFRTAAAGQPTRYVPSDFPDESLMLSGDLNIIDVEWVVQYRIADPIKFIYSMREPTRTLRDISESVMRRVVGNHLGSEVAREETQVAMDLYGTGIHIVTVELQNVVPPTAVQPAFNAVNEARQEQERMINEATKQANEAIPRARGEANRAIAEAQGYAAERTNKALGEAARFRAILAEYQAAPEVTRRRMYLEALTDILPRLGSVVVVQEGQGTPMPLLHLREAQPPLLEPAPPPRETSAPKRETAKPKEVRR